MDNNSSTFNNQALNSQQPIQPPQKQASTASELLPSLKTQQFSSFPKQSETTNNANNQNITKTPRYVKILPEICLILGSITIIGTLITILGLASGLLLSNQGVAMISSLLLGVSYGFIRLYGTIFCIASFIATIIAKKRYNTTVKRALMTIICGWIMIIMPTIIIYLYSVIQ